MFLGRFSSQKMPLLELFCSILQSNGKTSQQFETVCFLIKILLMNTRTEPKDITDATALTFGQLQPICTKLLSKTELQSVRDEVVVLVQLLMYVY